MAQEFKEDKVNYRKNCDGPVIGIPHPSFDYIHRTTTGDDDYPEEACTPYLQVNAKFDNVNVTGNVTASTFNGQINVQSWKGFDIKHPNKKNHRLRHICLEGPEAGVYFRGRLTNTNVIDIPEYWQNLVDFETITVQLTQIGYHQDLIVDKIEWGKRIFVKSGNGSNVDCYYTVQGSRIDGQKLTVEYEGSTPADYPGDSTQFSISGYDYGAKGVDRAD
jgi:hypothetical protein